MLPQEEQGSVSDVIAAGKGKVLQSVEVRRSLSHSTVTDLGAVAEVQTREATAVKGYRH